MSKTGKGKFWLIGYLFVIHILLIFLVYERFFSPFGGKKNDEFSQVVPIPSPIQIDPEFEKSPANTAANAANANAENVNVSSPTPLPTAVPTATVSTTEFPNQLMIPVLGVKKEKLVDTFNDARSENRVHNAIDIPAPQGTPVLAAADGQIARFFNSELGGITIYQFSKDKKSVFYYAHLQKIAENLTEKSEVRQGNVIAYVGDTGNAGAGNFHLHFSIIVPADEKRYWEGENINPFPLLKNGIEGQVR